MKKLLIYGDIVASCVGMSLGVGILLCLIIGTRVELNLFQIVGTYGMIAAGMIFLITPYSLYQSYVPLMLCMNCRRRELFFTFQGIKVLNVAVMMALTSLLMCFSDMSGGVEVLGISVYKFLGMGCCYLLIMASVGNLSGILYHRFGAISVIIFMVCSACGGGIMGVASVMGIKDGALERFGRFLGADFLIIGMTGATILTVLLDFIVSWRILRKLEIRC